MLIRITIAIADAAVRNRLQEMLARPDVLVHLPRARKDVWPRIVDKPCDLLIVSQALTPHPLAPAVAVLQAQPDSPALIVLADDDDPALHGKLKNAGCDAVLSHSLAPEKVRTAVEGVLEKRRRLTQRRLFERQPLGEPRLADFVSQSPGMSNFMNMVPRLVHSDSTLLIEGETGVGKERLACAIHAEGPRAQSRFVALNCGALPEHLLESELFGHVRGAFTGATTARRGWFEIAHQGTLFLDEIAEIPLHLQVKLLRVLQEQEIQPVGSEKSIPVNLRIIAASNRSLRTEVQAERFRQDLYYRLSVVTVTIPPLRHRREDIPSLVERHISYLARQLDRPPAKIHPQALQALCRYDWPGNVRELNNVLERALLLCDDTQISLDDLPETFTRVVADHLAEAQANSTSTSGPAGTPTDTAIASTGSFSRSLKAPASSTGSPQAAAAETEPPRLTLPPQWLSRPLQELREGLWSDLERQYLEGMLADTRGRIGEAARRVGLSARSLYEKMQQFGLHKEHFRQGALKTKQDRRTIERRNLDRRGGTRGAQNAHTSNRRRP